VFCALDKIDLAATVKGSEVAVQTDHRSAEEIEREPELSVLFAMARSINARQESETVHYVVANPPLFLVEALEAVGAAISEKATQITARDAPPPDEARAGELADRAFRGLAQRVAGQVGTRDLAMALRMLEDQTVAAPPTRDEPLAYWRRVLELAALTGELLRGKLKHGRWIQTDRALVPFGFELAHAATGSTTLFPTNRAQRVIEDGRDESLFKLVVAAEETLLQPPDASAPNTRLMPSLRDSRTVELDQIVWAPLVQDSASVELPVLVCGIDGESTFGILRQEAMQRTVEQALEEALTNLVAEEIELGELRVHDLAIIAVAGSFYASEKVVDRSLMRQLHDHLGATQLLAAAPARGALYVTSGDEPGATARFAAFVHARFEVSGNRAISPVVWMLEDGRITGFCRDTAPARTDGSARAETSPDHPGVKPGHRRPGRKA
jgi:hypothetical protein